MNANTNITEETTKKKNNQTKKDVIEETLEMNINPKPLQVKTNLIKKEYLTKEEDVSFKKRKKKVKKTRKPVVLMYDIIRLNWRRLKSKQRITEKEI